MSSKNNFYFTLQGFHQEVTGSSIVCKIHFPNNMERKFLIDFGLFQEIEYEDLNKEIPVNTNEIDGILITHSHADHIGRLPYFVKNGYNGPIYSTYLTKLTSASILKNSAKVFQSNYDKESQYCKNPEPPLFSLDDVYETLSLFSVHQYGTPFEIDDNITVTFFDNGHLLGAACILIEARYLKRSPLRILFTGDYKEKNTFKTVMPIPDHIKKLPLNIVTESTLCGEDYISYEEIFCSKVISCLNNNKGIVIPCLAQERFEDVLYKLRQLQESGYDFEICIDAPLAKEINEIYSKFSDLEYMPDNVIFVASKEEREIILRSPQKRILIMSSGMCDFGNAPTYLNSFLPRGDYEILFTSFLTSNSLGKKVMELPMHKQIRIPGQPEAVKKKAITTQTREFTSHATKAELVEFISQFKNVHNVFINHGSFTAQDALKRELVSKSMAATILSTNSIHSVDNHGNLCTYEAIIREKVKAKSQARPSKNSNLSNRTIPSIVRYGNVTNCKVF